jgi:hypothetical protein
MTEEKVKLKIQTTVDVPVKAIKYIIITAMEQGCGYWAQVVGQSELPPGVEYYDRFFNLATDGWIDFALTDEMGPGFEVPEGVSTYRLNNNSIREGLQLMANRYPKHFGDFMSDNHDAITADVFLQCCLLGDLVYG